MEGRGLNNLLPADGSDALQSRIVEHLYCRCGCESLFDEESCGSKVRTSTVMLLLGLQVVEKGRPAEVCVILNKRSQQVRQPGDLCCPGGTIERKLDPYIARLLELPFSPLSRWPYWSDFHRRQPLEARLLSVLLATGLREGWEEMRLNPLALKFLGPLPSQCLLLFRRVIHPMVAWVSRQRRFAPSWEVERVVSIPLRHLLNPSFYGCYRLHVPPRLEWRFNGPRHDFPCFLYASEHGTEMLWGVTYRIVTLLMEIAFGFQPPELSALPVIPGHLTDAYVTGKSGKAAGNRRSGVTRPSPDGASDGRGLSADGRR